MTEATGSPRPPAAPPQVVATAGHVDHGKSSLIVRLTGIDPDRLEEEKRRGLTIVLGFAWCTLPSGREIGFVDVPGHERFVRTMLAGVGPVRLVLFVVAADEGWSRQSEEHLAIVDVLGVDGAVVALTKRDLVDEARLARAEAEVRDRIRGTGLEGAPIVACSAVSGEGVDELVSELDAMVGAAPEPDSAGRARLFVDRVFTMTGSGTVVTGTLGSGTLAVGDDVTVHPSGLRARVRGLQTHKRRIEVARPVSRVAVNLSGVDRARLERGDVIGTSGAWRPTSVADARLRPVRGLRHPLTARGAFTFHAGASERAARLRLFDAPSVPEAGAYARITLSAPVVLDVGDRFVLRDSGRRETVAGGLILDPAPPVPPGADATQRLARRERSPRDRLPALLLAERGAVRAAELHALTGVGDVDGAQRLGSWLISAGVLTAADAAAVDAVGAFHRDHPLAHGAGAPGIRARVIDALRGSRVRDPGELADEVVDELVRTGRIERDGSVLRSPDHHEGVEDEAISRVVGAVAEGEPTPPTIPDLVRAGFPRETLDAAIRFGDLVRIAPEVVVTRAFVERAVEIVRAAGSEGITVSAVRQALGTSRRFALPLMEHLDRAGETRRSGDLRFARGTSAGA